MILAETDLELIEDSLDGDAVAAEAVAVRVAADAAFAEAVAEAALARDDRRAFWDMLTPTVLDAERFAWRVRGAIAGSNREQRPAWWMPSAILRYGSVAAACIVFGFYAGRSGSHLTSQPQVTGQPAKVAAKVMVPVSDQYGQIVMQPFNSADEAREFYKTMPVALKPQDPTGVGQFQAGQIQNVSDDAATGF
jgi:hypothetical protein